QVRISMEGWPDALDRLARAEANQISEVFVVLARYIVDVLAVRLFIEGGVSSDILEQQLQWFALDDADKRDDMLVAVQQPSGSCAALAEVFGWQAAAHIAERAVQSLRDLDEEELAQKMAEAFEAMLPEGGMQRTTMALDRVMRMEAEDPIAAMRECEKLAAGAEKRGDVAARLRFLSTRGWLAARAGMMDEARVMFDRTLPLFQAARSSPEVIPAIVVFLPLCARLGELSASRKLIEQGLKMTASRPELAEQRRVLLIEMDLLRKYEAKDRGKAPRRR
ncbi:MAG: hypothetical protein WCK39_10445, partial [Methanomassiliicoccales archaeon]